VGGVLEDAGSSPVDSVVVDALQRGHDVVLVGGDTVVGEQ